MSETPGPMTNERVKFLEEKNALPYTPTSIGDVMKRQEAEDNEKHGDLIRIEQELDKPEDALTYTEQDRKDFRELLSSTPGMDPSTRKEILSVADTMLSPELIDIAMIAQANPNILKGIPDMAQQIVQKNLTSEYMLFLRNGSTSLELKKIIDSSEGLQKMHTELGKNPELKRRFIAALERSSNAKPKETMGQKISKAINKLGELFTKVSDYFSNALAGVDASLLSYIPGASFFKNNIDCARGIKDIQASGVQFTDEKGEVVPELPSSIILKTFTKGNKGISVVEFMEKVQEKTAEIASSGTDTTKNMPIVEFIKICKEVNKNMEAKVPATPTVVPAVTPTATPPVTPTPAPAAPPVSPTP